MWIGIPADNTVEPANLLTHLQYTLAPNSTITNRETVVIGGRVWRSTEFSFDNEAMGGPVTAKIAATAKDEVGYYVVSLAPSAKWAAAQPFFNEILDSFAFTAEAVLRPTDATPPPTPTATPTPVVYIVQSGDSLGYIASIYGVTVEALSVRNGIDDPRRLQVGARLIIPLKR
ncbi:MAG: LysM peptidoglycan-binding domain-containing protein [Anaerolineaceae bacterium]|nr:LysM peptidoglycan-binding domain-containing protein [Anaerolineaceae bacterium]MCB9100490.1 LysM peptidoglycan-binding domain-containing protein [Anaerolineales bacterium]